VVSESRVTWATSVPILVFIGLSVLDLGPTYATDVRQTSDRHVSSLNAPYHRGEAYSLTTKYAQQLHTGTQLGSIFHRPCIV